WIAGLAEAPDFDDAADRRCLFEGLDPTKANVVRASICSVYQGVGLTRQFIVQSPIDQSSDDLGGRLAPLADVVGNAARFPTLGKGAVHSFDDIAAHAEVAQATLGLEPNHPFPWRGGCSKPHLLQVLKAADHQPSDFGIQRSGILGA